MLRAIAALLLVLALLIAVIPQSSSCQHEGKALALANGRQAPMRCYWTARGELALAAPLLGLALGLATARRRESGRALALLGALLGLSVIALPTWLIGTCASGSATCNLIMRPSLILLGSLVTGASLLALVVAQRQAEAPASRPAPGNPAEL